MKTLTKILGAGAATALISTAVVIPLTFDANATNYPRSAFGSNPHAGVDPNASHGWGNAAWPNCPTDISTAKSKSGDKAGVRSQLAPLVSELMNQTEAMGYQLKPSETGGFNCRAIRGSNKPSNHSKGKAVDLNWNSNPMSSTFKTNIPPKVVKLWESHGFYWGGRYNGRVDTMHFEYIGTPASVKKNLADLKKGGGGKPTTPPKGDKCDFTSKHSTVNKGDRGAAVKEAQCLLAKKGYKEVGSADGIFGAKTDAAVRHFQKNNKLKVDGYVGPKTWAKLHG